MLRTRTIHYEAGPTMVRATISSILLALSIFYGYAMEDTQKIVPARRPAETFHCYSQLVPELQSEVMSQLLKSECSQTDDALALIEQIRKLTLVSKEFSEFLKTMLKSTLRDGDSLEAASAHFLEYKDRRRLVRKHILYFIKTIIKKVLQHSTTIQTEQNVIQTVTGRWKPSDEIKFFQQALKDNSREGIYLYLPFIADFSSFFDIFARRVQEGNNPKEKPKRALRALADSKMPLVLKKEYSVLFSTGNTLLEDHALAHMLELLFLMDPVWTDFNGNCWMVDQMLPWLLSDDDRIDLTLRTFWLACQKGDVSQVALMLNEHTFEAYKKSYDAIMRIALIAAANEGHSAIVTLLTEHHQFPWISLSIIKKALAKGHLPVVQTLIEKLPFPSLERKPLAELFQRYLIEQDHYDEALLKLFCEKILDDPSAAMITFRFIQEATQNRESKWFHDLIEQIALLKSKDQIFNFAMIRLLKNDLPFEATMLLAKCEPTTVSWDLAPLASNQGHMGLAHCLKELAQPL